jgi:multidrug efflux pump subunit AcrB
MLPMAIFATECYDMRATMAVAAIGGLISATVLTLLVLPAGYIVADNISKKLTKRVKTIIGTHED